MELVAGKKAVILGLGISGGAAVHYLRKRGLRVAVSEYRFADQLNQQEREFCQGVDLETGGHTEEFILQADYVVPSPGVPLDLAVLRVARDNNIPILGELALAADEFQVPVIAVTGSNGKTTVTALIGEIARSSGYHPFVGGNIGTPLLSYLLSPEGYDLAVLELSSFQLELSGGFRPDVALLLNLSPDHLDRHGDMAAYARAKGRIMHNQQADDTAILGADDPMVMELAKDRLSRIRTFGYGADSQARIIESKVEVRQENRESFELAGTALDSKVNRLNAAAAVLAAQSIGMDNAGIRAGLAGFTPPEHRMTLVSEHGGVKFINDSKATNVGAMAAALESCPSGVILLAGGRNKGGDFTTVKELVREKVRSIICIGEAADLLYNTFADVARVEKVADMAAAVKRAASSAKVGQTVLLAPGCASFDMFTGYAERGKVFTDLVLALPERKELKRKTDD